MPFVGLILHGGSTGRTPPDGFVREVISARGLLDETERAAGTFTLWALSRSASRVPMSMALACSHYCGSIAAFGR